MSALLFLFSLICALFVASTQCIVIGSNSAVSQEALASFPLTDTDNEMRGFAVFAQGFTLNGGGSCVYNAFYPIAGTVTLNGGTLSLSKDLIFQKGISFYNGGIIQANSRQINFLDTNVIQLPVTTSTPTSVAYVTQINTGKAVISSDWSYDAKQLAVVNNASSSLSVYDFIGSSIMAAGVQSVSSDCLSVRWHPSQYYVLTGRKQSKSSNNLQLWQYLPVTDSFILLDEKSENKDITAIAWHPSGTSLAVGTESGGRGVTLYSFSNGLLDYVSDVTLSPSRNVSQDAVSWNKDGTFLVVGTESSNAANGYELLVYSYNGSILTVNAYQDLNLAVSALSYSPAGTFIAVGLSSGSERLRIYSHNSQAGTLIEETTARIGESLSVTSLAWSPDGNYLALGRASGTGTEFRVYGFDAVTKTLSLIQGFDFAGAVNTVRWSPNGKYILVGDSINFATIYGFVGTTPFLIFDSAKLQFNSDVSFNVPITFKGSCLLDGNNHVILSSNLAPIIIDSGATLALKNVTLKDVTASSFYCVDSTSKITFDNVTIELGVADYDFMAGSFDVGSLLHIKGPYGFNYKTNQVSSIKSNALLLVDRGSKFKYDPSISSATLFTLTDYTSCLVLNSATLQVSNTGLQLTKGVIELDGRCYIVSEASQSSQGLLLGDGVSSGNNVTVRLLPEATCEVTSGFIVDKSV